MFERPMRIFPEQMTTTAAHTQHVDTYIFPVFSYSTVSPIPLVQENTLEAVKKYRDTVAWRLLCLEERVAPHELFAYWEILDELMELSVQSAIRLLQNLYEYRIRKLRPVERNLMYPGLANEVYRLEYLDQPGGRRDICVDTLLREAIDLLQEEAQHLIRT